MVIAITAVTSIL